MFCIQCGQQLPEYSVACFKCGYQIIQQVQPIPQNQPQSEMYKALIELEARKAQNQQAQKPQSPPVIVKQTSGVGVAFFTVLLLVVFRIGGFIVYQKLKPKPLFGLSVDKDGINVEYNPSIPSASQANSGRQPTNQSFQSNRQSQNVQPVTVCQIVSQTKHVNLRENCDVRDCDTDGSTATYEIDTGDSVTLTGRYVPSSKFGKWVEVNSETDEGTKTFFVAESKLNCN